MSRLPLGLQLFSLREAAAADPAGTLAQVAEMGYEGVEFAGFFGWPAAELRRVLDDAGLQVCGAHIGIDTLLEDQFEASVEFHQTLGNQFLIVPGLPPEYTGSAENWKRTAGLFNDLSVRLAPLGMYVGYHCHAGDFRPTDGQVPWEILADNTDSAVVLQMDTGNCLAGGADPLYYLEKYPGRGLTVHLKADYVHHPGNLVGESDTDWPAVFAACESTAGTRWYIVEQESYPYPPLESVRKCLENLRRLGR